MQITNNEAMSPLPADAANPDKIAVVDNKSAHSSSPMSVQTQSKWTSKIVEKIRSNQSETAPRSWESAWIRFGPLTGILSLLLVSASLVAALGILVGSNGDNVDRWKVPPSTYLAIFTAIANLSVRYAATQGVVITWWRRARQGSTVSNLHTDWRSGTSLRGALAAGRHAGLLGLACISATVVFIDGPLFQRASTVITTPNDATVPLSISMAPEIPHGFTGIWLPPSKLGGAVGRMASAFNSTMPTVDGSVTNYNLVNGYPNTTKVYVEWANTEPLTGVVHGCPHTCKAKIRAPGLFSTACKTHHVDTDVSLQYNITQAFDGAFAAPLAAQAIIMNAGMTLEENESFNLITGFATYNDSCNGVFEWKVCKFVSGIGEYDILIEDNKIIMTNLADPQLVAYANNTATDRMWSDTELAYPSTLGGVVDLMRRQWESYIMYFTAQGQTTSYVYGTALALTFGHNAPSCSSFSSPFETLVSSMNRLMFTFGAAAAKESPEYLMNRLDPGLSSESNVIASLQGDVSVYHTDYWFFFVAALIEVICIVIILPTYWEWWKIGRPVSLSPLEIAKAFKSPLLAEFNSNTNGTDLATATRERDIQYGLTLEGGKSELGFGKPDAVSRPTEGMKFDM